MTEQQRERVKKWVAELRSNKYEQVQGRLHKKDGFCCLGVACETYKKTRKIKDFWKWDESDGSFRVKMNPNQESMDICTTLPSQLSEYFGLNYSQEDTLWRMNDGCSYDKYGNPMSTKYDFSAIADYIEKEILK